MEGNVIGTGKNTHILIKLVLQDLNLFFTQVSRLYVRNSNQSHATPPFRTSSKPAILVNFSPAGLLVD